MPTTPATKAIPRLKLRLICSWALLQAILLPLLLLPSAAQAQFSYITNNGTITITGYTGSGGDVTIPGTIDGLPVTTIEVRSFYGNNELTSLTIPASVTAIAASAFYHCNNLTALTVDPFNPIYSSADGVLFNKSGTILLRCPGGKVASYAIPGIVTNIGESAFFFCTKLSSVSIPHSLVTIGESAFWCCSSLTNVLFGTNVSSIGGSAFYSCTRLETISLPDSVTNIGDWAFAYSSLADITLPNNVTALREYAFYRCSSLANVSLGNRLTTIDPKAFSNCENLTTVGIPESVTSIGSRAFSECASLTNITIPESVTNIGSFAFASCTSLSAIQVDSGNLAYSSLDGVLFDKGHTMLIQCPAGKAGNYSVPTGITTVGNNAFVECASLTSITIPNTVISIQAMAFYGCSSLSGLTLPDSLTSIGEFVFNGCTSLGRVLLPDSLTSMGNYVFANCTSLTNAVIGNGLTTISNGSFSYCTSLRSVTVSSAITAIGERAFSSCKNLISINFPESLTSIGSAAFENCTSMTAVNIPDHVTQIGDSAFQYCSNLTTVNIGLGVTWIGQFAFYDCGNLTSVTLSSNLITIGDSAFSGCSRLTNVTIPNSVTSVGYSAFRNCLSLTEITIPQSLTSVREGAFSGCDSLISITVDAMNPAYSSFDGVLLNKDQTTLIQCPSAKAGTFVVPASVTTIENNAFYKCTNLSAIAVDTRNGYYTSVGGVLFNKSQTILIQCPGGKVGSATVPATVTNIPGSAFYNCIGLTSIDVDSLNPVYSSIDGVLFNKSQTILIRCPPSKTGSYAIPPTVTNLGDPAFFNCTSLTNILIPQSVIGMGDSMFDGCTSLDAITVDTLNPVYSSLDGVLFNKAQTMLVQCPKGRSGSYAVPQGVTVISNAAFFGCGKLTSVTVPESLTRMNYRSFFSCNSLRAIYCKCNEPLSNADLFRGTDVTIYYLPGTVGWESTFEGRPAVLWNPQIQTAPPDFGVGPDGFGLPITGTPDIPILIEAATGLSNAAWVPLQTLTLTNGSVYFSDPDWTNFPARFYRIRSP